MGISIKLLLTTALSLGAITLKARETYNFNSNWTIGKQKKTVTLPHAWNEKDSYKVGIKEMRDSLVTYTKTFALPASAQGKKIFIEFEGARQAAEVFINGKAVGLNENGVMAFGFDITPYIVYNGKNTIKVITDNSWKYKERSTGSMWQWNNNNFNANYGGLPKNVWLHVMDSVYQTLPLWSNLKTTGTYVYGKDYDIANKQVTICVESEVRNETDSDVKRRLIVDVADNEGRKVCSFAGKEITIKAHTSAILKAESRAHGIRFWSWGYGYLYKVNTTVGDDVVTTTTGFRKTAFKNGMVYLNDRVMMVHGYAQRTSNEWPGVGMSVPAWLSDYSNDLMVKSGGNVVRWMHVAPWKQDVESCDRVGLIQAMPAGDAEKDVDGRRWEQREEVMRDAIIYFRNNPSILFYECGNQKISAEHMVSMKAIRDLYDPNGGRAIGSREMLDRPEAEYGGEMLYVNKSDTKPMWMMEYCRDEALRWYWNSWSYPYHKEGDGPLYRNAPANAYNHNNDEFVRELVERWYDYWLERPGSGTKVNSGGVKIIFSDTQTHGRSADNYRVSGVVDPMRIEKDAFYAHQVMWDGWVDDLKPRTHIVGHWNYSMGDTIPTVYVVSNADSTVIVHNGKRIAPTERKFRFLNIYRNLVYKGNTLTALGIDNKGKVLSADTLTTAGQPHHIMLTPICNPTGWKADGHDVALVQVDIVDANGQRCPLANHMLKFKTKGEGEWLGGISKGKNNHAFMDTLRAECGVTRVMLRSTTKAGDVTLNVSAEGLPKATVTLSTNSIETIGGLSKYMPADGLPCRLDRGETPSTPSFKPWRRDIQIADAKAGNGNDAALCYDGNELSAWESRNDINEAWITFTLAEKTQVDEICLKMKAFRQTTYPIAIYAGDTKVWEGWTPKSLSYIHIPLKNAPECDTFTIRMIGYSTTRDAFGAVKEMDKSNDEKVQKGSHSLKIIEAQFLKNL